MAKINDVEDKIDVAHEASVETLSEISDVDWSDTCIMLDIEAGEFEFITDEVLQTVRGASLIIEVHDQYMPEPGLANQKLREILLRYYEVNVVTTTSRDLSHFEEVKTYHDNDRWLLCSEGRGWLMEWSICRPLSIGK